MPQSLSERSHLPAVCNVGCQLLPRSSSWDGPGNLKEIPPCPNFHSSDPLLTTRQPLQPVWKKETPRMDGRAQREQARAENSLEQREHEYRPDSYLITAFPWRKIECEQSFILAKFHKIDSSGAYLSSCQSKMPLSTRESGTTFVLNPYFCSCPTTIHTAVVMKYTRRPQALHCLPNQCYLVHKQEKFLF